ncbi:MAG: hypothetical protein WDN75_11740 [Bacteroidota bacterium]
MKKVDYIRALTGLLVICFLFTSIISRTFDPLDFFNDVPDASESEGVPVKQDASDTTLFDEEEGEDKSERDPGDGKFYKVHFDTLPLEFLIDVEPCRFTLATHPELAQGHIHFDGFPLYLSQRTLLL